MLRELRIENLALVETLHLVLRPGLTVLTGETGAGKSLIVGALDLALGARASADRVRKGATSGSVTARFDDLPPGLEEEAGEGILLRRVILADGGSRAYVNDRPVAVRRLRELAERLADLHGQHEQQTVLREDCQLDLLDAYGKHGDARGAVADAYETADHARIALEEFRDRAGKTAAETEFLQYQARELDDAELQEGEEDQLERERRRASHAGRLAESVNRAAEELAGDAGSAADSLGAARQAVADAAGLDDTLAPHLRSLDEALVIAEETGRDLSRYAATLELDPARQDAIEERLSFLAGLRRKYHTDLPGLIQRREELRQILAETENRDETARELEAAFGDTLVALRDTAVTLTRLRSRSAARLGRAVGRELTGLGMPDARLTVELSTPGEGLQVPGRDGLVSRRGAEGTRFLLAANKGEAGGPLQRVASGGETSRVMLALKKVLGETDPVGTLIFDEIDTGIGGVVAEAVGRRLAEMARGKQVIAVTHLPMIASRGDSHLVLSKATSDGRTRLSANEVSGTEREAELARMMAGEGGGEEARRTARTLLERAPRG